MRKLYSILFTLLAVCTMAQAQVLFDFANNNLNLPASYKDHEDEGVLIEISNEDVTITFNKGEATTDCRLWDTGTAKTLRVYKGSSFVITAPKNIINVTFDATNSNFSLAADPGTLEGKVWTGSAPSVTFTPDKTNQIRSITVTLEGGDAPVVPTVDWTSTADAPLTVAAALEKAASLADGDNSGKDVYVKGKVAKVDEVSAQFGNATYFISDDGTDANTIEIYRGKGLNGANFEENGIKVGDEVVVVGLIKNYKGTIEFDTGSKLYSLNGETGQEVEVPEFPTIGGLKSTATAARVQVVYKPTQVLVTYVNGKSLYVFDGTDGLLLYGTNTGIKAGDIISAEFKGELYLYNGLTEIATTAVENLTVHSSGNEVNAQKVTVADVNNSPKEYENELVQIEGLTPAATALESNNIKFIDDSDNELAVRDNWSVLTNVTFDTEKEYSVTGFVAIFNDAVQIYPRTAEDVDNGEEPEVYEFVGEGTLEKPYTVEDIRHKAVIDTKTNIEEDVWVKGYIVGYINGSSLSDKTAVFSADAPEGVDKDGNPLTATVSNLLIADAAQAGTVAEVIPVATEGKGLARADLNLADNPDKLGTQVWLQGNITKYMGVAGLKEVKNYSLDGINITAVLDVKADAANATIYNLAGQRVSAVGKGVFVVGKKKVLAE